MNIGKLLVIAPHPDDEINLAAQFILSIKEPIDAYVLYTTNGDNAISVGNKRLQEAIDALSLIGIEEDHVIFLGYANGYESGKHIFGSETTVISKIGKTKTSALPQHPEYCLSKYGIHHAFTYDHYRSDLKNVIEDLMPNTIICVDFDSHPDHRAASLTFDIVMGEILKERDTYRPLILKKFAYNGVWNGPKDYYITPPRPTIRRPDPYYSGAIHELESPAYTWGGRISMQVDPATLTRSLRNNIIYKMSLQHRSTTAWYHIQQVVNADITYWHRPTDNYMLHGDIQVSSGEGSYLNDFVLYGYNSILNREEPFEGATNLWIPDADDNAKTISVNFASEQMIRYINIYEDCSAQNHIKTLQVLINGSDALEIECNGNGTAAVIDFGDDIPILNINFTIDDYTGRPGIAEIELLPSSASYLNLPIRPYTNSNITCKENIPICIMAP